MDMIEYSNFSLIIPNTPGVANVLVLLPTCSRTCSLAQLEWFKCDPTDWTCICDPDISIFRDFNTCFDVFCGAQDGLEGNRVIYNQCGVIIPPNSSHLLIPTVVLGPLAIVALLLRFASRIRVFGVRWGLDDWICLLVLPFTVLFIALQFILVRYGFGRDVWTLETSSIINAEKYFVMDELAYVTLTVAMKISILCFYLRIFRSRNVRLAIYGLIGLCIAALIGYLFSFLFQCRLPQASWLWYGTNGDVDWVCDVDGWALIMAFGFSNVVLDLVVMIFPVPILVRLKMSKWKKARVVTLSCVGVCITIIAIIRLVFSLSPFNEAELNFTRFYQKMCIWSVVEVNVSIICACMPQIDILYRKVAGYYLKGHDRQFDSEEELRWIGRPSSNKKLNRLAPDAAEDTIALSKHDIELLQTQNSCQATDQIISIASLSQTHPRSTLGMRCMECQARLMDEVRREV